MHRLEGVISSWLSECSGSHQKGGLLLGVCPRLATTGDLPSGKQAPWLCLNLLLQGNQKTRYYRLTVSPLPHIKTGLYQSGIQIRVTKRLSQLLLFLGCIHLQHHWTLYTLL